MTVNDYEMIYDIHTHTVYSHGSGTVEDNVRAAIDKGLEEVAISDHGPGHLYYGIKRGSLGDLRGDIETAREKYPQIKIGMSVELNTVKGKNGIDMSADETAEFDYILGGYHFGARDCNAVGNWLYSHGIRMREKSLRESNTEMIIRALRENDLRVLTHPGDKGPFDIDIIAMACEETNTLMEINNRHGHLDVEEIRIAMKHDVKFIISSDAHSPEEVGTFEVALERALLAGLDPERIVNIRKKK